MRGDILRGNVKYERGSGKGVAPEAKDSLGPPHIPAMKQNKLDAFPVIGLNRNILPLTEMSPEG